MLAIWAIAVAENSLVEGNVVDGFTWDGMRGVGDSIFRSNLVMNCFKVDKTHRDGFQSYSKSTVKNLTAAAGLGASGFQGATSIAVRQPAVHWSGTKAIFSMVVGAPTGAGKRKNGIGLLNMRERIERHEGEFEFHSEPGATRVTAFIPHKYL